MYFYDELQNYSRIDQCWQIIKYINVQEKTREMCVCASCGLSFLLIEANLKISTTFGNCSKEEMAEYSFWKIQICKCDDAKGGKFIWWTLDLVGFVSNCQNLLHEHSSVKILIGDRGNMGWLNVTKTKVDIVKI